METNNEISDNKNVLILNGATRINGNTDISLKKLIEGAVDTEVKINQINLRQKEIGDCIGCCFCHDNDKCSINDDMMEIYETINKSEVIIFASPVYWWGVTGIMKIVIDRLYFYHSAPHKALVAGKKAIIISPMNMNSDINKLEVYINFFNILFENLDMKLVDKLFFGNINDKGAIKHNTDYLKEINILGKNLKNHFKGPAFKNS